MTDSVEQGVTEDQEDHSIFSWQIFINALLIFLILVLFGVSYWIYDLTILNTASLNSDTAKTLSQLESRINNELFSQASNINILDSHYQNAEKTHSTLLKSLNLLREQMTAIQQTTMAQQSNEWQLLEIEHRIELANLKLKTEQDIGSAIALLKLALKKSNSLNGSDINFLQIAIQNDLDTLKTLSNNDLIKIIFNLNQLRLIIPRLKLNNYLSHEETTTISVSSDDWKNKLRESLEKIKSLIQIRKRIEPLSPLLNHQEAREILNGLRLQILEAEIFALNYEATSFKEKIIEIKDSLSNYFEMQESETEYFLMLLDALSQAKLSKITFELNKSKNAVDNAIKNKMANFLNQVIPKSQLGIKQG